MSSTRAIAFQRSRRIIVDARIDTKGEIEDVLRRYAELTSAAGNLHTYRVTELALWSAASSGLNQSDFLDLLHEHSAMRVPADLIQFVNRFFGRFGLLRITGEPGSLQLTSGDPLLLREVAAIIGRDISDGCSIPVSALERGRIKARLATEGYPVLDEVRPERVQPGGYQLRQDVQLRDYQRKAVERFIEHAHDGGVILLPCGSGKTVVGVSVAANLDARVLVVTPNRTIGEQWADHFTRLTTLAPEDISLFADFVDDKPVAIMTYQALTAERNGSPARMHDAGDFPWGLVIYDEVHTLPADVFRQSAALQSRRRLGLTATLVREDGREREVFALVGPPVWQSRWRDLERQGWISPVECVEVRVRSDRATSSEDRGLAAKLRLAKRILARHPDDQVLIAAHRVREVLALSRTLGVPAVYGETPQAERARLYEAFRSGEISALVVSRVANVGVDLPDANVLIQVSGTFGSRLEEAQRLGRLLRPKNGRKRARFYSLVLPETREREFAERRQRFLVDQGYHYQVINARG